MLIRAHVQAARDIQNKRFASDGSSEIVCQCRRADVAISVSGIAGPGGGLPNKPVGTTWFGLSTAAEDGAFLQQFEGDRRQNNSRAATAALQILLEYLQGRPG